jgi:hypothetical protein
VNVRIDIAVNDDVLRVALEELKIAHNPPTITTNWQNVKKHASTVGFHKEEFGHYILSENHVALQTLPPSYVRLPLFQLQPRIRETLLHELRHAHQHQTWPEARRARMFDGPYHTRDAEIDARGWAYKACLEPKYRDLVKVTRTQLGKGVILP